MRVTRSQTRASQGGSSLSSLLQARSEACTAPAARRSASKAAQQQPQQQQQQVPPESPLPDIDAADRGNPLTACEYVNDVYRFYRRVEPEFRVPADYMSRQVRLVWRSRRLSRARARARVFCLVARARAADRGDRQLGVSRLPCQAAQTLSSPLTNTLPPPTHTHPYTYTTHTHHHIHQADINEKMRAILVDWLVEVHLKFKLMPETLFLAVALIDRYLAAAPVARKNLQLVGVTAMLVAAKYEEIWAPEVRDFVYISDKAYDRAQILAMERRMLRALDYKLTMPTTYQYLARLLKAAGVHYEKPLALFVAYCAELCLVDYGCLRFTATELAAAIMHVALRAFGKADAYPRALARHARMRREDVLPAAKEVVRVLQRAPGGGLQAVVKKYGTAKFCEASAVPPPVAILDE